MVSEAAKPDRLSKLEQYIVTISAEGSSTIEGWISCIWCNLYNLDKMDDEE